MRKSLYAFAFITLGLSGCSNPPSAQTTLLTQALDAYVKGDFKAFDGFAAQAQAAADQTTAGPDYDKACTVAATDARRALALARELHGLDASPVFSMSDEARYVYLSADYTEARQFLAHSGARMGCEKADGATYNGDVSERMAWIGALYKAERSWRSTLRQRSPADFEQRLDDARAQLERNHMGHFVETFE